MAAQPSSCSTLERATVPSMSQPPGTQSVAEMRIQTGFSAGKIARTATKTSRGKRMRFSRLPPYSSSRLLARGDKTWCSREPCAPGISIPSRPRRAARRAALTKSSRTRSSPARSSARGTSSSSACGTGEGATDLRKQAAREGVAFGALLGDKAFDADWLRAELDDRGAAAVIPPKVNRKTIISFDRDMYGWRHLIENTFAKLKEFRAVATRYDKTDTSYTATIHLAAAIIASR